jgi:hypothetical protein
MTQSLQRFRVIFCRRNSRWYRVVCFLFDPLDAIQTFKTRFLCSFDDLDQQILYHLVANCSDPNFLSLAHQFADHTRAGECLP